MHFDTSLFSTVDKYQWYEQYFSHSCVVLRRNIYFAQSSYFRFQDLFVMMEWLPTVSLSKLVFLSLVRAFYAKMRYCVRVPISYTFRGAKIELDADSICRILGVPYVRLRIYESNV